MIIPSATNMKFKFPEFVNVDDATVEFAVEEAVITCGNGDWIDDSNQTLAIMYLSAHLLMVSIMRAASSGGQLITSERTPDLSRTYAVPKQPDPSEPIDLTMTIYGVRYLGLVDKNFPAILTVGSAIAM